jgi:ribose 5-phosphate isomerase B
MKIAIGSDHGGFKLKRFLIDYLKKNGHNIIDVGCFNDESCDYPQYSHEAAALVSKKRADKGITICKSGIGSSIVANKVKGIRAALCYSIPQARSSRGHNDANVLALGAAYTKPAVAKKIVSVWLRTKALGGRHERRVKQIEKLEKYRAL